MTITAVLTVAIVVMTLLPLSRSSHWWVRGMDFPRLQIVALSAALLLAQWWLLDIAKLPAQAM
ncbi:MAG: endonuclease, partial [Oxalobacteraceae bacterium]